MSTMTIEVTPAMISPGADPRPETIRAVGECRHCGQGLIITDDGDWVHILSLSSSCAMGGVR